MVVTAFWIPACTAARWKRHVSKAASGALGLVVNFKTDDGRSLRQTFWMTSGSAKGCKNYYEKDGEKHYLPGFILANSLSLLTTGQEISQLETEKKVIRCITREAKAEVPTKVDMVMDMLGKEIWWVYSRPSWTRPRRMKPPASMSRLVKPVKKTRWTSSSAP